jgi:hypothetical protein
MCAKWEMFSGPDVLKSCMNMYKIITRINVRGISPELKFVNEDRRIIINTTPEAPISALLNNSTFNIPVTRAVVTIITRSAFDP